MPEPACPNMNTSYDYIFDKIMKSDTLERNKIEYGYSSWENVGLPQFIETPRPGISLNDCYTADKGPALASGTQALVRLLLEQAKIDRDAGLNTKGLVSGYPGSPLGA